MEAATVTARTPQMMAWFALLENTLGPQYTMPNVWGGHDILHVTRMIALGPKILGINVRGPLIFNMDEFEAAVWLHNLDRIRIHSTPVASNEGLADRCRRYLIDSPFSAEARERIVDAVIQHGKYLDDLSRDSSLLTALRIADKVDSLGALRILMAAAHRGGDLPMYDPAHPFPYKSIEEDRMGTIYDNLMRCLRWYGMLPSDAARELVPLERLRAYVDFLRALGAEIALLTNWPNRSEDDIKRAINEHGNYYHLVANDLG